MRISNTEIHNTIEPLQKLLMVKLPVKASLALIKLAKQLQPHQEIIEEVKNKLIRNYGEEDKKRPGGGKIAPGMPGFSKFAEEFGILLGEEVEMEFDVVKLQDTIEIEPYVLMALERFVEVVRVEPKK